ncbi:hypothetical protein LSAT2_000695 [Lamellibrachia satsuma]|nr:hypothetical protein LSAT2_000695 [Lamellibrachia satsuma]
MTGRKDTGTRTFHYEYDGPEEPKHSMNPFPRNEQSRVLPRVGYPAYQQQYQMPYYYGMRIPYVSNVLSRYPVYNKDATSREDSESDVTSSTMSQKSDRLSTQKRRLMVLAIVVLVTMGIALTAVAIWLSVKTDDKTTVSYKLDAHLKDKTFTSELENKSSDAFKALQDEYCNAMAKEFAGLLVSCTVDKFTNGSIKVKSTLVFRKKKLEKFAEDKEKVTLKYPQWLKQMKLIRRLQQ